MTPNCSTFPTTKVTSLCRPSHTLLQDSPSSISRAVLLSPGPHRREALGVPALPLPTGFCGSSGGASIPGETVCTHTHTPTRTPLSSLKIIFTVFCLNSCCTLWVLWQSFALVVCPLLAICKIRPATLRCHQQVLGLSGCMHTFAVSEHHPLRVFFLVPSPMYLQTSCAVPLVQLPPL